MKLTASRQNLAVKAIISNGKAWSKLRAKLQKYRKQRYVLRVVWVVVLLVWLVLNVIFDKTDVVPVHAYFLLLGVALLAFVADIVVYFFKVLPKKKEMDDLNGPPT